MITAIRVPKAIIKDNASKTDILSPPDEQRKPTHRLSEGYYSISYYKNKCDCDRKQICLSGKNQFSRFAFKFVLKAFNLFAGKILIKAFSKAESGRSAYENGIFAKK